MKCFYHADADGRCAGFWVCHVVSPEDELGEEYIEINYGMPFPFDKIHEGEQVYIVDYSIEPDEMLKLLEITKNVTWIDHHKTAIEKYKNFPVEIRGLRYDGIAACMLTYCFLRQMTNSGLGEVRPFDVSMTRYAPAFTKLIADWDVWKFEYGDETRSFVTAFNAYDFSPTSNMWNGLIAYYSTTPNLVSEGRSMIKFRDGWAKEYCRTKGFETIIGGHKAFALNLGNCNSEYFKSIEGYDILMPFCFDGDKWTVSLYSTTVDVSEIAKTYGGGGHRGASGFQCKELPFKKNQEGI